MAVCFLPRIYVDAVWFRAYQSGGYLATFNTNLSGIIQTVSDGFYTGAVFFLLGYKEKKKLCTAVLILVMFYSAAAMSSGRRQEKVGHILVILFIYFRYVRQKTKRKTLFYYLALACMMYFALVTLASFGDMRLTGGFTLSNFSYYFIQNLTLKMLLDQMMEFGMAGLTLAMSFKAFPLLHPFELGKTYLFSWVTVFPRVGGFLTQLMDSLGFVQYIQKRWMYGLGASCIIHI